MTQTNTTEENTKPTKLMKWAWWLVGAGCFVILSGLILFSWGEWGNLFTTGSPIKSDKVGQFGDLIGGVVGSLWALAGVILFYAALKEQRKDFQTNNKVLEAQQKALEQQIKEFKLQKEEMEQTREVFKLQSETLKQQQFESTFFNLIDNIDDIKTKIENSSGLNDESNSFSSLMKKFGMLFMLLEIRDLSKSIKGGGLIPDFFIDEVKTQFRRLITQSTIKVHDLNMFKRDINFKKEKQKQYKDLLSSQEKTNYLYNYFYSNERNQLAHYHRLIYHTLKFVKDYWTQDGENHRETMQRYADILQAQFSKNEQVLIYYNSLIFPKMFELVKEFQFVENLYEEDLLDPSHKHDEINMKKEADILEA